MVKGITMGLSASQAKLLSITSRLSTIELQSQNITRAKQALANDTAEMNRKYNNALNHKGLVYTEYDESGEKITTPLTGATLMTYSPIKNQYGIVNAAGQILVSEKDAANYEDSANINEFLAKYGFGAIESHTTQTVVNPAYSEAKEIWQKEHDEWETKKPDKSNEKYLSTVPDVNNEIYIAVTTSGGCFENGLKGLNCYMHALADLIGPGEHETSTGETYTITDDYQLHGWYWDSAFHQKNNDYEHIRELLKAGHCSGDVLENTTTGSDGYEYTYSTILTVPNKLIGGPVSDPNMSLYQRAIDLLWEVHGDYPSPNDAYGGNAKEENLAKFFYYVEHDLKQAITKTVVDEKLYDDDYQKWLEEEPQMEDIPPTIEEEVIEYQDMDKAQWYVNLWHRMNGASQEKDGYTTNQFGTTSPLNGFFTNQRRWEVLEDGLMNSSKWLQCALESGSVTLERVNYANPTQKGTGLKYAEWTSIIYTNAIDITEQTDSRAVAKAEAEFNHKQKVIEAKDKQYDSMLKLLDTEHSALEQEYETAKAVVAKNTERTLKIYSA